MQPIYFEHGPQFESQPLPYRLLQTEACFFVGFFASWEHEHPPEQSHV